MAGWSFAQPDWVDRLRSGRSLVPALPLDVAAAARAAAIFDMLRLPDVPGLPMLRDAAGDWFRDIVRAIFGSLDPDTGVRRVRGVFVLVPKKNSKTTNGAALMLTALLLNQRPSALFGLFGPTQEIADIALQAVAGMVAIDPELSKLLHVRGHKKDVVHRITGARLKVTTFDTKVATGGKFSGWLLDEMHLLGRTPYTDRVLAQLRGARSAITESFGVIITTQSDLPPAGAFKAELDAARAIRDGAVDSDEVLPVLYEFPEAMQVAEDAPWRDEANWPLVTPNLGKSVSMVVLRQDYAAAKGKGDEAERLWASQHLNIQIGMALHNNRWEGVDYWQRAAVPGLTLDGLMRRCDVVTVGIDGGGLDDLLGLVVIGREKGTRRWLAWGRAWADRGIVRLREGIVSQLRDFERNGDFVFVDIAEKVPAAGEDPDGTAENDDVAEVADIVLRLHKAGLLPERAGIGVDAVGIAAILDALAAREIPGECIAAVPQGYRLSGVIKGAARKLKDGTLKHCGQPLMAWAVSNARTELRGSATLITKQVSGAAKIDPLIALLNAFDLMSRNPEPANDTGIDDYIAGLRGAA